MNFLPVVTRELRVGSRLKRTYWSRTLTALVAITLSSFFLITFAFAPSGGIGETLFATLSFYAFGLCLLGGAFLTADCLSEEKREGTLGLLFLTDLTGFDVVLGKFMARSLNAFYGLLAIFPILGLPLLLGGVTGDEFWRITLALLNSLFFSVALGMCVSAASRESQRALGNTVALLILFTLVPLLGYFLAPLKMWSMGVYVVYVSPFTPFRSAFDAVYGTGGGAFESSLLATHLLGWVFLAAASLILPRKWQDKPIDNEKRSRLANLVSTGRVKNPEKRAKLLTENPVLWLMSGGRSMHVLTWAIALGCFCTCVALLFFGQSEAAFLAFVITWPFTFLLKLIIAIRATYFYAEARRTGALEMLLSTPLTNREIVSGQWLALRRTFFWPVLVTLLGLFFLFIGHLWLTDFKAQEMIGSMIVGMGAMYAAIKLVLDVCAVAWFGMWMGLSSKKPSMATAWTILIAVFAPSVVVCCYADLAVDLFLIFWSKSKLEIDLRTYLAGDATRQSLKNYNNI